MRSSALQCSSDWLKTPTIAEAVGNNNGTINSQQEMM